ncbi:MAG: DUF2442 domain-containing protein [Dyadobacter sp.]|uniref:DUF2442 domain-containing protein n=1 Tax=Dyadobacter sp. TaxID=1914288 RepID=UPI003265DA09
MKTSFKPGAPPSVSKDLTEFLSAQDDNDIIIDTDDLDKIILSNNLKIRHFTVFRDLDLVVFILNNKRIIQRPLSSYPALESAIDYDLYQYQISDSGIHWPEIDADLSLRGLLLEETVKHAAV